MSNFTTITFVAGTGISFPSGTYNTQVGGNLTHINNVLNTLYESENVFKAGVNSKSDFRITHSDGTTSRDFIIGPGTAILQIGKKYVKVESSVSSTVTVTAAGANPRIDQIVLAASVNEEYPETAFVLSSGTATGGATLDNMTGANATYLTQMNSTAGVNTAYIKLVDVVVPVSGTIAATDWRDRRPVRAGDGVLIGTALAGVYGLSYTSPYVVTQAYTTSVNTRGVTVAPFKQENRITFSKATFLYRASAAGTITNMTLAVYDSSGRTLGIATAITLAQTAAGTAVGTLSFPSSITLNPGLFYMGAAGSANTANQILYQAYDPNRTNGQSIFVDPAAGTVLPNYLGTVTSTWDASSAAFVFPTTTFPIPMVTFIP